MWVGAGQDFCEDFERRELIYVRWTAIPNPETSGWGRACMSPGQRQNPTPSTKDEAQLNCVALRPPLDFEVAWKAVKGRDERLNPAPLTALHATAHSIVDVGEKQIWRAATSALTFMTFS